MIYKTLAKIKLSGFILTYHWKHLKGKLVNTINWYKILCNSLLIILECMQSVMLLVLNCIIIDIFVHHFTFTLPILFIATFMDIMETVYLNCFRFFPHNKLNYKVHKVISEIKHHIDKNYAHDKLQYLNSHEK